MNQEVFETVFIFFSHLLFVSFLGYYLVSALQWYSYKLERIVFHYHRYDWHLFFFFFPLFVYYIGDFFFYIYLYIIFLPTLFLWYKKLDKKLVFTARVKRFFLFLFLATIFQNFLCLGLNTCEIYGAILPLFVAVFISMLFEKILFAGYKKAAKKELESRKDMIVFAITASYGKTSIKNYLFEILSSKYTCYKTPRSVNTLAGIIKDINEDLPRDTQIYIVEAGARLKGDIDEIARFLNPHFVIVGQIGEQHIEYFKTLENIRNTKMELINSTRLQKAFVHKSANVKGNEKVQVFGDELEEIHSSLAGIEFDVLLDDRKEHFKAPLLGEFNAYNLLACIIASKSLLVIEEIRDAISKIKSVEHRLQKIEANGKIIIDDSFNGNFEGMSSSYELVRSYEGRKVIVTPGIIESNVETNVKLAQKIDDIFDVVIITGKTNQEILEKTIKKAQKVVLKDKTKMQEVLQEFTCKGDLILFSNDTPSFM